MTSNDRLVAAITVATSLCVAGAIVALPVGWLDRLQVRGGGAQGLYVAAAMTIAFVVWAGLLWRGSYGRALVLQLMLLNGTSRGAELFALVISQDAAGNREVLSFTTGLLALGAVVCWRKVHSSPMRPRLSSATRLLLAAAVTGTFSQFMNLPLREALLFSILSIWQYAAVWVTVNAAIREPGGLRHTLAAIPAAIVGSILVRLLLTGAGPLADAALGAGYITGENEFARARSLAFGGIYYAGYVAVALILSVGLLRSASKKSVWLWMAICILLTAELAGTFTRGAVLSVMALGVVVFWQEERRWFARRWVWVCGVGAALWVFLAPAFLMRMTDSVQSLAESASVGARFEVWRQALAHVFDNFGFGYGIGHYLVYTTSYYGAVTLTAHGLVFDMTEMIGALATTLFLSAFWIALVRLRRRPQRKSTEEVILARYLFASLIAWFLFANTTALSILFYTPCEATVLFYAMLFAATAQGNDSEIYHRNSHAGREARPLLRRSRAGTTMTRMGPRGSLAFP